MKKIITILSLVCATFSFTAQPSFAAFVQFNPKNAQFISPSQKQSQTTKTAQVTASPKVPGISTVNDAYLKSLVTSTVNQMVAEGLLKGEKGDKGEPASF